MGVITIPVTAWRPDTPPMGKYSQTVKNCVPRVGGSYGPMPGFQSYATAALASKCMGAYAAMDTDGNVDIFAGTATDLYEMVPGGTTFASVSKSAAVYTLGSDQFWRFALVNSRVVASNINDAMQSFVLGSSTKFANLSSGAPKARYIAGVKQWLMAANTFDAVSGNAPWRLWWSAINDPTSWPTAGTSAAVAVQSDYTDIIGEGGWITGLVGNLGTADVGVFFEHSVWRGVYVGPPSVFNFYPAEGVRGTRAPQSIAQLGSIVFYLGEDGFYAFDGTTSTPIGAGKMDETFFADLDQNYLFRVMSAIDPVSRLLMVAYPGSGHTAGNPNHILLYNWITGEWTIADIEIETLFRTIAQGYTLDTLGTTGYNLDTLPYSLDSRQWTGGTINMGAFNTSHVMGTLAGSNLAPTIELSESQLFPGRRAFIRNARPLCDGGTPTVSFGVRDRLEDAVSFNAGTAMNSLGTCPQRVSGRYITPRITLPAASSFTHVEGLEIDADQGGVR